MTQKSGFERRKEVSKVICSDIEAQKKKAEQSERLGAKPTAMESSIVARALAWLNKQPGCKAEKTHGGAWGNSGKPDITGSLWGLRFEFEAKVDGKDATKLQKVVLKEWSDACAIVGVIHSLEEIQEIFESYKDIIELAKTWWEFRKKTS